MLGRGMLMESRGLSYRSQAVTLASATVGKPSGVALGDLVIVLCPLTAGLGSNMGTSGGGTWSVDELTAFTTGAIFWKVMDATDVANTWTKSDTNDCVALRWQGPGTLAAAVKSTQSTGGGGSSTLVLAGFTPSVNHRAAIAMVNDLDAPTGTTTPTNFTSRYATSVLNVRSVNVVDWLGGYAGGTVTFANLGLGTGEMGWLLEVT